MNHQRSQISYTLSVPSKTFLLGEYVATSGGAALLMATSPRFRLLVRENPLQTEISASNIYPSSPAGHLIKNHFAKCEKLDLTFIDPYQGLGGFGASGAQFMMLFALLQALENKHLEDHEMLDLYQRYAWSGSGIPPSGLDLVLQHHGGLCCVHESERVLTTARWPFPDLNYCLIHTGNKLPTHVHLEEMQPFDTRDMEQIVRKAHLAVDQQDSQRFVDAVGDYGTILGEKQLVSPHTQNMMKQLSKNKSILAMKGCGALGADVIVLFFHANDHQLIPWLNQRNYNVIAHGQELEEGLKKHT